RARPEGRDGGCADARGRGGALDSGGRARPALRADAGGIRAGRRVQRVRGRRTDRSRRAAVVRALGAVLAGGRSRRFGSDKASAMLGEETLLGRAVGTLRAGLPGAEIVVVSSRE